MVGCVAARHDGVLLMGSVYICVHVLIFELGAAGLSIEWAYRPNGNSGS